MPRAVGAEAHLDWHAAAASALAWWHEAGVDMLVDEDARDWLAPPAALAAPLAVPVSPATDLPATLDAYLAWRHVGEVPEAAWPGGWIAASGPGDARLMVLVDCPDRDDGEGLLSGAAGRLFDRMLAAIGLSREQLHLASVCAKRPTAGRVPPDATERLHALARHHVGLLAPQRLLVLGNAASRAVLATDVAAARGRLHPFNHDTATVTQVVASFHPRFLLEKPAAKAGAWADLQRLRRDLEI